MLFASQSVRFVDNCFIVLNTINVTWQDKEGIVYQSEIEALLKELDDKDFPLLAKALEVTNDSNDYCHLLYSLREWSCTMGSLARSHLAYHLRRINLLPLAQRYVTITQTLTLKFRHRKGV